MSNKLKVSFPAIYTLILGLILSSASQSGAQSSSAAYKTMEIGGSVRYRHELITEDNKDNVNRHRVQAKLEASGKINPFFSGKIGLASGGGNHSSANETLDGAFTKKKLGLDLAYITLTLPGAGGVALHAGKCKNPFLMIQKSELIWDSDIHPEGVALNYNGLAGNLSYYLNSGFFWVDERTSEDDAFLFGAQAGGRFEPFTSVTLDIGGGFYHLSEIKNHSVLAYEGKYYGNSSDSVNTPAGMILAYSSEYSSVELYSALGLSIANMPVSLFGHFVFNTQASSDNTGYLGGVAVGKAKNAGTWALRYYYKVVEKDAIFGAFADSDFGGGGTDCSGHEANVEFAIFKDVSAAATYFINKKSLTAEKSYQRGQFDLKIKF